MYAYIVLASVLFCGVNCVVNPRWERQCIEYFATGTNYELTELPAQMYGVYFWPPNQRQRLSCEHITYRRLSDDETTNARFECSKLRLPSNEPVMRASYTNSTGKPVTLLFYGRDEVKEMYRTCDKNISKYIFIKVNDNYVLGINCSAGGRGILMSRYLPPSAEVHAVVTSMDIMSGREGSADCPLPS